MHLCNILSQNACAEIGVLREKSKVLAGAARDYLDRSVLWNTAEDVEPRSNAVDLPLLLVRQAEDAKVRRKDVAKI
jgi:hypothetical protein